MKGIISTWQNVHGEQYVFVLKNDGTMLLTGHEFDWEWFPIDSESPIITGTGPCSAILVGMNKDHFLLNDREREWIDSCIERSRILAGRDEDRLRAALEAASQPKPRT